MGVYKMSIDAALRHIRIARDRLAIDYEGFMDTDWALDQFDRATTILEQLRDYEANLTDGDQHE